PEPTIKEIEQALEYVKDHKKIREVVISGGDPLTLPTEKIDYILSKVDAIRNVESVRIGTRTPVVLPSRIDDALCEVLEKYDNLWVNVQFNHPRELTAQAIEACRKLQKCGIPVSNQSVLLKGVNDDPEVMTELCQKLQANRIRPYYLFQCDPVVGAYHFITSIWKGVEIIEKMRGHTGGMCVPSYVIDGIDGKGKIPVGPNYLVSMSSEGVTLRNYRNETFFYPNVQE
ncbi:MAG: KamA family radical SAM protein, partial [Candidatus Omnitrophica bacterium]|nr:KamA family radical SAM protein [Candidatus Omnitrophota bacterium]